MKLSSATSWAIGLASLVAASSAGAQVVTYTGVDIGASAPGANAIAARNAFVSATGGSVMVDWERASVLPTGFSFFGGNQSSAPSCLSNLCGNNTTPAGTMFLELYGAGTTFSFSGGVNYFGGFFGGLQLTNNTINFFDGSSQSFTIPGSDIDNGGFAFAGFTDLNQSIASVTIGVGGDIISVDDLIFGTTSVVPEPSTYAMMLMGIGAVGFAARRRRKV